MIRKMACFAAAMTILIQPAWALSPEEFLHAGANSMADLELRSELSGLQGVEREKALYLMGEARERLGDYASAAAAFEQVSAESAWYPQAIRHLADLYVAEGKASLAARAFGRLLPTLQASEVDKARLAMGNELYSAAAYDEALYQFHQLEDAADPAVREAAWYGEGWSALKTGLYARAYYAWSQILDQFPHSKRIIEARLNLANHFLRMGRYDLAADQILAVSKMPGMTKATLHLPTVQEVGRADHEAIVELDLSALADFVAGEGAANDGDWVRAMDHYRAVPKASRWAEQAAYGLGWVLWQAGRLPEAYDQLSDVLRTYPHGTLRAATYYTLGRVEEARGLKLDAADAYQEALKLGPGKWAEEALYELASLALGERHSAEAEKWARQLQHEYPKGRFAAPGLWLLAEAELAAGDTRDAITNYDRLAHHPEALDFLDGKSNRVVFKLGIAYLRAGDLASAQAALSQVHGPVADQAMFWRAEALYGLGKYSQAANLYATYLKHDPHGPSAPEASYGLAWALLKRGDRLEARQHFHEAAKVLLDPRLKHDAYYRLSLLDMDAGDFKGAEHALKLALAIKGSGPDDEAAYFLAFSQLKAGEIEPAAEGFSAIVAKDPDSTRGRRARRFLAQCDMQLGKFAEAGQLYEGLAQSSDATASDLTDLRLQAATAYSAAGDYDRSATLYDLIAADASASAEVRQDVLQPLVTAYLDSNELPQAESVLVGQASGSVWAPELLRQVADSYAGQKRWREAAAVYSEIPGGGPDVQIQQARALRQAGELQGAAGLFETLTASSSVQQPELLLELADLYGQMGVLDQERQTLERADKVPGQDLPALAAAWFAYGDRAFRQNHDPEAAMAFRMAERRATPGSDEWFKARYWLGAALVESRRPKEALLVLEKLVKGPAPANKDAAASWQGWRSMALLEQGEAHEHMRQWAAARRLYEAMTHDDLVSASDKDEAEARLAFIKQNVPAALLRKSHD